MNSYNNDITYIIKSSMVTYIFCFFRLTICIPFYPIFSNLFRYTPLSNICWARNQDHLDNKTVDYFFHQLVQHILCELFVQWHPINALNLFSVLLQLDTNSTWHFLQYM